MGFWNKVQKMQDQTRRRCAMIVPAAGTSQRMGGENKLLMDLCGVPVLKRTLMAIDRSELVDEVIVAANEATMLEVADLCAKAGMHKPIKVVKGGDTRTASVLAAAMELVLSPSPARCRACMPVCEKIHSSFVSSVLARSSFVTTFSGR